jgi:allophanate hydrolase
LSTAGVVPACRTLDCVSIFAHSCDDARAVWQAARGADPKDPYSRSIKPGFDAAPWSNGAFRFGVPADDQLEFFGDKAAAELYREAIEQLESIGGEKIVIDYTPFRAAAELLYSGPWVAERLAAIEPFLEAHGSEMNPVVHKIISGASAYTAVKSFQFAYKLEALRSETAKEWAKIDVLVLPTTGTTYTIDEVNADPIKLNSNLGYYTNFVNLLDLSALAVPAGFRPNGLPFGITLMGQAFQDEGLLDLASRYLGEVSPTAQIPHALHTPGCVLVAVVGAHLSGQPLNWQLVDRGARLLETRRTHPSYRLFELPGQKPAKPGLLREPGFNGPGIEVEVWAIPENQFGSFVAAIPAPLGIGTVELDRGDSVKCFLCEPYSLAGAREITNFGGWRAFVTAAAS